MTHRGRFIHFSSQAPRRSRCALVHHSSSQAPRLLALRARPPQLVASSSAARAARSPTTARRKLLGGSRCALTHHSSLSPPRRSRCALASSAARAARSPVTARHKLLRWSSPFPPRGWPRVASFCTGVSPPNSARVQSSTAALRRRSSKLKCLERAAGAASSHGLPNHPHAQSHKLFDNCSPCLLYTSPSPRDKRQSRMPSSA